MLHSFERSNKRTLRDEVLRGVLSAIAGVALVGLLVLLITLSG
jgi:hypothetical protein